MTDKEIKEYADKFGVPKKHMSFSFNYENKTLRQILKIVKNTNCIKNFGFDVFCKNEIRFAFCGGDYDIDAEYLSRVINKIKGKDILIVFLYYSEITGGPWFKIILKVDTINDLRKKCGIVIKE